MNIICGEGEMIQIRVFWNFIIICKPTISCGEGEMFLMV